MAFQRKGSHEGY